jgi:hypothetical protein
MSTFTVPAELSTLLGQLKDRTELRDTSGSLLGVFTPQASIGARQDADLGVPFDLEEADRILEEERNLPGYTLEEIWRELGRVKSAPA